jgi:hypothetical protein
MSLEGGGWDVLCHQSTSRDISYNLAANWVESFDQKTSRMRYFAPLRESIFVLSCKCTLKIIKVELTYRFWAFSISPSSASSLFRPHRSLRKLWNGGVFCLRYFSEPGRSRLGKAATLNHKPHETTTESSESMLQRFPPEC